MLQWQLAIFSKFLLVCRHFTNVAQSIEDGHARNFGSAAGTAVVFYRLLIPIGEVDCRLTERLGLRFRYIIRVRHIRLGHFTSTERCTAA
jgi:hypothetical protein